MKIGVRFGLGDYNQPGGGSQLNDRVSLYAGYARSLTGDFWYKDMLRARVDLVLLRRCRNSAQPLLL